MEKMTNCQGHSFILESSFCSYIFMFFCSGSEDGGLTGSGILTERSSSSTAWRSEWAGSCSPGRKWHGCFLCMWILWWTGHIVWLSRTPLLQGLLYWRNCRFYLRWWPVTVHSMWSANCRNCDFTRLCTFLCYNHWMENWWWLDTICLRG